MLESRKIYTLTGNSGDQISVSNEERMVIRGVGTGLECFYINIEILESQSFKYVERLQPFS
jgi:hypothetical protein